MKNKNDFFFISILVFSLCIGELHSAKRIVVGVSEFKNITKDRRFDWLSTGIPESLTTDLAEIKSIKVVENRKKIVDILTKFGTISDVELGNLIGANILVLGSFQIIGEQIKIDARFVNLETGQVMAAEKFQGKTEKIFDLYPQIVLKLADSLGIKVTPSERRKIEKPETRRLEAYEKYVLAKRADYYEHNKRKAYSYAKEAVKMDPEYKVAKEMLGFCEYYLSKEVQILDVQLAKEHGIKYITPRPKPILYYPSLCLCSAGIVWGPVFGIASIFTDTKRANEYAVYAGVAWVTLFIYLETQKPPSWLKTPEESREEYIKTWESFRWMYNIPGYLISGTVYYSLAGAFVGGAIELINPDYHKEEYKIGEGIKQGALIGAGLGFILTSLSIRKVDTLLKEYEEKGWVSKKDFEISPFVAFRYENATPEIGIKCQTRF